MSASLDRKLRMARLVTDLRTAPPTAPTAPAPLSDAEVAYRNRWLTMEEAADHLRYTGDPKVAAESAYCYLRKHRIRTVKRGNYRLVRRGDIDDYFARGASDFVERARAAREHR
jgi:hypothetical protein